MSDRTRQAIARRESRNQPYALRATAQAIKDKDLSVHVKVTKPKETDEPVEGKS